MRIKQLDALRAIACLMVIGYHSKWVPVWSTFGWSGVDLFFVLSGFLISGLLFREYQNTGSIRIGRFLVRRGLKIYPAYYLFLFLVFLYVREHRLYFPDMWQWVVFTQNFLGALGTGGYNQGVCFVGHLWSIAVEEHFYVLLPLGLWVLVVRRKSLDQVPRWCGIVMVASIALRIGTTASGPHIFQSQFRFDGLAFGVLLSYFWHFNQKVIDRVTGYGKGWPLLVVSLLLITPSLGTYNDRMFRVGLTSLYIGYGGLLIYFLKYVDGTNALIVSLARIGAHSYTIYLVHMPVLVFLSSRLTMAPTMWRMWMVFMLYTTVTIAIGVLFSKLVEKPVLRIRDRILPARDQNTTNIGGNTMVLEGKTSWAAIADQWRGYGELAGGLTASPARKRPARA